MRTSNTQIAREGLIGLYLSPTNPLMDSTHTGTLGYYVIASVSKSAIDRGLLAAHAL